MGWLFYVGEGGGGKSEQRASQLLFISVLFRLMRGYPPHPTLIGSLFLLLFQSLNSFEVFIWELEEGHLEKGQL